VLWLTCRQQTHRICWFGAGVESIRNAAAMMVTAGKEQDTRGRSGPAIDAKLA